MSNLSFSCFLQNVQVVLASKLLSSNLTKIPKKQIYGKSAVCSSVKLGKKNFCLQKSGLTYFIKYFFYFSAQEGHAASPACSLEVDKVLP